MTLHPTVAKVTERIIARSADTRSTYLGLVDRQRDAGVHRPTMSCGNLAHGFAASGDDKAAIRSGKAMNIGIVTAYNDMLSAHQPYGRYPEQIKIFAREKGATAQIAGGVPAMCDGVTQGQDSMELSLFSRDIIAMSTSIALSHGMFEGALLLGICRQDRAGLADRRIALWPFANNPRARWPDAVGAGQQRKNPRAAAFRRRQGGPRRIARGRKRQLSQRGNLHLFWHCQLQPDDDGDDGAAYAGQQFC